MSRSGYIDSDGGDEGDALRVYGWQANVKRCVNGRKGQAFMWELYLSLEAISSRQLVKSTLIRHIRMRRGTCAAAMLPMPSRCQTRITSD